MDPIKAKTETLMWHMKAVSPFWNKVDEAAQIEYVEYILECLDRVEKLVQFVNKK